MKFILIFITLLELRYSPRLLQSIRKNSDGGHYDAAEFSRLHFATAVTLADVVGLTCCRALIDLPPLII